MPRGGRSNRGSGRGPGGAGRGPGGAAGRGPGGSAGRPGGGSGSRGAGSKRGGSARGTMLNGGPLDGQKAQVPLEDGWFDLFPQPQEPSASLDPDEVGHRYKAEGHRWVYAGTVTAAQSEADRQARDEADAGGGDDPGE